VKTEKDFKVATANWTSQSAKLYGIVKWLWVVLGCFWHPVISGSGSEIQGTTAVTAEAEHPKWGERPLTYSFILIEPYSFCAFLEFSKLINLKIEYASQYCLNRITNKLNKDMPGTENAHSEYVPPHPAKCTVVLRLLFVFWVQYR